MYLVVVDIYWYEVLFLLTIAMMVAVINGRKQEIVNIINLVIDLGKL